MDSFFETQKASKVATEKAKENLAPQQNKREKLDLHLKVSQEKDMQVEEQTFSVEDVKEAKQEPEKSDAASGTAYLQTFENKTVADLMREETERQAAELKVLEKQKESLSEAALDPNMTIEQFQKSTTRQESREQEQIQQESLPENAVQPQQSEQQDKKIESTQENTTIIERPNYDFLQEQKKTIKLSKKQEPKKRKFSKKTAGIVLACALAGSAVICVGNAVLIDQMSASYFQIDETYKLNLAKYLKSISNLDATKKSMSFLETYPDELLQAGDLGEKSNWFDRLCNFIGGLFGG